MKRFVWLVGLMALGSPACARDYSFVFRGHDIHIEAIRHCRSLSCVSVHVGDRHNRRDRDDDEVATVRDGTPPGKLTGVADAELMKRVTRDADYTRWTKEFLGS